MLVAKATCTNATGVNLRICASDSKVEYKGHVEYDDDHITNSLKVNAGLLSV